MGTLMVTAGLTDMVGQRDRGYQIDEPKIVCCSSGVFCSSTRRCLENKWKKDQSSPAELPFIVPRKKLKRLTESFQRIVASDPPRHVRYYAQRTLIRALWFVRCACIICITLGRESVSRAWQVGSRDSALRASVFRHLTLVSIFVTFVTWTSTVS